MKRLFYCLAFMLIPMMMSAQKDIPAGMRMEIAELELDDNEYSVFQYKDPDGTTAYYLSLGNVFHILGFFRDDITDMAIDHFDEACLVMGKTQEEAVAFMDELLEFLNEKIGTKKEFQYRKTNGADLLTDTDISTCTVTKRFLQSKRLSFQFVSGKRTVETDLKKSTIKNLRLNIKINKKLHPDKDDD